MNKITVQANANIALIKYWGKRDQNLFLPTKSSLSVTLSGLTTITSIEFNSKNYDEIVINNHPVPKKSKEKIVKFLNLFRKSYNIKNYFKINTKNEFPTAAGLASSASGFVALSYALNKICNLNLTKKELSILTRRASGSAARSVFGGFAIWHKGQKIDGSDSYAEQLFPQDYWPDFCVLVAVVNDQEKKVSSRDAMQITVKTSPFYDEWVQSSEQKIPEMIKAIKERDLKTVGLLAESDCLDMHKTMQTSIPAINYWQPETIDIMNVVKKLRDNGIDCYFTIDAGPNVKILCLRKDLEDIKKSVQAVGAVKQFIVCGVGYGVGAVGRLPNG